MSSRPHRGRRIALASLTAVAALAVPAVAVAAAADGYDFGLDRQQRLEQHTPKLFGFKSPLAATAPTVAFAKGAESVALAEGLEVTDVLDGDIEGEATAKLGQQADMIAFWPTSKKPEWAIVCIEGDPEGPGLQRIGLRGAQKDKVETILTGTESCDGVRRTAWGTILFTEERPDGWALELYDPLETTAVSFDRTTGALTGDDAGNVRTRPALGRFAWEGIGNLPDGTVIAGDELAPQKRANGGAMFKFVSDQKPDGTTDLSDPDNAGDSPYAAGKLYAYEAGATTGNNGQGNERGVGVWQGPLDPAKARAEGQAKGTGFYRPEDLHVDPIALEDGRIRVCWTNTGNAEIGNYGEVLCLEDRKDDAAPTGATPEVQRFLEGNSLMNQPDNLDFQPGTGIVYVIEDTPLIDGEDEPGDIWACLPDGKDRDVQTDGCVLVLSVKTEGAEPTGFIFDASGRRAYLNIQHSPDDPATEVDEGAYDEMLVIEGWGGKRGHGRSSGHGGAR